MESTENGKALNSRILELKKKKTFWEKLVKNCKSEAERKQREYEELKGQRKVIEGTFLQRLKSRSRVYCKDPVLDTLCWFCHNNLQVSVCGLRLANIIIVTDSLRRGLLKTAHLECGNLFPLALACNIISEKQPPNNRQQIQWLWNTLSDASEICFVAKCHEGDDQKIERCFVPTTRENGRIWMYDPQQELQISCSKLDLEDKAMNMWTVYHVDIEQVEKLIQQYAPDLFNPNVRKDNDASRITEITDPAKTPDPNWVEGPAKTATPNQGKKPPNTTVPNQVKKPVKIAEPKVTRLTKTEKPIVTEIDEESTYHITMLENEIERLKEETEVFKKKKKVYEMAIMRYVKQVEEKYLQLLESKGRVCSKDCVPCALHWICKTELKINVCCCRWIIQIITARAAALFPDLLRQTPLVCANLLYLAWKCNIVRTTHHITRKDKQKENESWQEDVARIWNDFKTMKEICLVGEHDIKIKNRDPGHCMVCDPRKQDNGKIWFCDPQQEWKGHIDEKKCKAIAKEKNLCSVYILEAQF